MSDRPTLESLMFAWGDAYIFAYARDRWIAIRRDGLLFLAAGTLTQMEAEIEFDYGNNPILDECDSLDAARDYLTAENGSPPECADDLLARTVRAAEAIIRRAAENHLILSQLRALFPGWDIEYCEPMRGWIAHRKGATIWENSPLDIRLALTLIEQKQDHRRQHRRRPAIPAGRHRRPFRLRRAARPHTPDGDRRHPRLTSRPEASTERVAAAW